MRRRLVWRVGIGLLGLLTISMLLSVAVGAVPVPLADVWNAITQRDDSNPTHTIIYELRLPRVLLALVVGAALGLVGTAFQGLLRNPLADPYIVGVSSGAAVGAAMSVLLGWAGRWYGLGTSGFAFLFGLGTLLLVIALSRTNGQLRVGSFLLAGVAISASLWGVITLLLLWAGQDLSRVLYWLMGGLLDASWERLGWSLPLIVAGSLLLFSQARELNLYTAGEETAKHLGVQTERLKWLILVGGSLVTAAVVSVAGIIGFVGWIVPHFLRRLTGGDHRFLMPLSALGGGILLLWADTVARVLTRPTELPVGVITALLGTPFFLWMLRKKETE
jgi:iron complex transport system permease protein